MELNKFVCPSCKSNEWEGRKLIHKPNCELDMSQQERKENLYEPKELESS